MRMASGATPSNRCEPPRISDNGKITHPDGMAGCPAATLIDLSAIEVSAL
jgi:hypothetical protein